MAISRMQEPRQLYGLGSLVKSIGKTIKKVVKSPIGKAAILGIGAFGLPGGALGMKGFLPQAFKTGASNFLFGNVGGPANMYGKEGIFSAAKKFLGSTAGQVGVGAALSALAASGMDQEEIAEIENDPEKLRIYLKDYYSKTNPDKSAAEIEEFVRINSATGGRIGFANGKNMKMASMEENEIEFMRLVEEFMEQGFSQQEAIDSARDELERKSIAIGGRVGLKSGTRKYKINDFAMDEQAARLGIKRYYLKDMSEDGETYDADEVREMIFGDQYAVGGRVGLEGGANEDFQKYLKGREEFNKKQNAEQLYKEYLENKRRQKVAVQKTMAANGGLMPTGIMRANKAGTIERDYRETGGFVPVGIKEKADDVPAMLSKNEFVMTADAVRGMGDGNIEKGAQRLYDQMKQAEKRVV